MATRSLQLAAGRTTDASNKVVYTVPSGDTVIFKSAFLFSRAAAPQTVSVHVFGVAGGLDLPVVWYSLSPNSATSIETWVVLRPGDQLVVNGGGAGVDWILSGAQLPGVV